MKRACILAVFALTGCGGATQFLVDEFNWISGGDPSAEFSQRITVIGPLEFGQTSPPVAYHNPPRYRGFSVAAQPGDKLDVWVRSTNGNAVVWIMDANYKTVAANDDALPTTKDSHAIATVPPGAPVSWFIVFRDRLGWDATFTVSLAARSGNVTPGGGGDFFSCAADADCTAIPLAGCCKNGKLIAVNAQQVDAYNKANACTQPNPICPEILFVDKRVAECNFQTKQCEMIDPNAIHCGGNLNPHHDCPSDYQCKFAGVPDVGGTCEKHCDVASLKCEAYQHPDATACACADNPSCGGAAGTPCSDPAYPRCIDDPRCDPSRGACSGLCAPGCLDRVMCKAGMRFDPIKCGCVPSTIYVPRWLPYTTTVQPQPTPSPKTPNNTLRR